MGGMDLATSLRSCILALDFLTIFLVFRAHLKSSEMIVQFGALKYFNGFTVQGQSCGELVICSKIKDHAFCLAFINHHLLIFCPFINIV